MCRKNSKEMLDKDYGSLQRNQGNETGVMVQSPSGWKNKKFIILAVVVVACVYLFQSSSVPESAGLRTPSAKIDLNLIDKADSDIDASSIAVNEDNVVVNTAEMFEVFPWEYVKDDEEGYFVGYLELCDVKGGKYGYRTWDKSESKNKYDVSLDERPCGETLAPLIRMVAGRKYKLVFLNNAHIVTNLHTHGLHVAGVADVDDITRMVEPGKCLTYHYHIRDDADVGTFLYHSHLHPIAYEQMGGGAYGLLIVDETEDTMTNYYPFHLRQFLENEVLLQFFSFSYKGSKTLHNRTVNLLDTMTLHLEEDVYYNFRISVVDMNTPVNYIEFYPENACETRVVAYDGVYRSKIPHEEPSNLHVVTVTSRLDLAVSCTDDATIYYYKYRRNESDAVKVNIKTTASSNSDSASSNSTRAMVPSPYWDATAKTQWQPRRPYYMQDLSLVPDVTNVDLSMDDVMMYGQKIVAINHELWDETKPLWTFPLNTTLEMDLYRSNPHPIHFHINRMQIVQPGGCGYRYEEGEYFDTIAAQTVASSDDDVCKVRMQFNDFAGRVIAHCHRLNHEDAGMMFWVDVTGGPEHGQGGAPQMECSLA